MEYGKGHAGNAGGKSEFQRFSNQGKMQRVKRYIAVDSGQEVQKTNFKEDKTNFKD